MERLWKVLVLLVMGSLSLGVLMFAAGHFFDAQVAYLTPEKMTCVPIGASEWKYQTIQHYIAFNLLSFLIYLVDAIVLIIFLKRGETAKWFILFFATLIVFIFTVLTEGLRQC